MVYEKALSRDVRFEVRGGAQDCSLFLPLHLPSYLWLTHLDTYPGLVLSQETRWHTPLQMALSLGFLFLHCGWFNGTAELRRPSPMTHAAKKACFHPQSFLRVNICSHDAEGIWWEFPYPCSQSVQHSLSGMEKGTFSCRCYFSPTHLVLVFI